MKKIHIITIIIATLLTAGSWANYFSDISETNNSYTQNMILAQNKVSKGLYQEAFSYFDKAKNFKSTAQLWDEYYDAYSKYYKKYPDFTTEENFLNMLKEACGNCPYNEKFYCKQIELYLNSQEYSSAKQVLKRASYKIHNSENLDKLKTKIDYSIKDDYDEFEDIKCGEDYYSVKTYSGYKILDTSGDPVELDEKPFINVPGDDGVLLLIDQNGETCFNDVNNITHGFIRFKFTDIGRYVDGLIPIKSEENETYAFYNIDGEKVLGDYDYASSFKNGIAAVRNDNNWRLINTNGDSAFDATFSDIKINHLNQAVYDTFFVAAEEGTYNLYSTEKGKISNIDADAMDEICGGKYIAYRIGDTSYFMDISGNEVESPTYSEAHSFSNGLAAVKIENTDNWGYINEQFELVIKSNFTECGYFYPAGTAAVKTTDNVYKILKLYFGLPK